MRIASIRAFLFLPIPKFFQTFAFISKKLYFCFTDISKGYILNYSFLEKRRREGVDNNYYYA